MIAIANTTDCPGTMMVHAADTHLTSRTVVRTAGFPISFATVTSFDGVVDIIHAWN